MEQHSAHAQHHVTMTQVRREVSLDSQGQSSAGGGGSLGNSRLTLTSRGETPVSLRSGAGPAVDESVQVDLSADTCTYDSDDEMAKRRGSLVLRNKRGHPIFSREDIREQYCINRKEVEVLENARSLKFFGCITNTQDNSSPCSKNSSLLFSCIQKKKKGHQRSSSDDNIYAPPRHDVYSQSHDVTSPSLYDTDRTYDDEDTRSKDATLDDRSTDDEEYILSGFRKRPKTFCDPNRSRTSWIEGEGVPRRRKLESSASFGSTSQQSYDEIEVEFSRGLQRPSQLNLASRNRNECFQNSRSVDELNDNMTTRRRREPVPPRTAKTPDILDDRRQKHVSFDNGSLVRSNTVAGGLEEVDRGGPAATSTPLNMQRRSFSPPPRRNRSQERLLDGSLTIRPPSEFSDRSSVMSSRQQEPYPGYRITSLQHRPRRAMMKTQATQTELTFKSRCMLPAYLTLSPRALAHHHPVVYNSHHHHSATRQRGKQPSRHHRNNSKTGKSQSAHNTIGSDDTDEEVMEVDLSNKQPRLLRSSTCRASIRRQRALDSPQEEIMVSFKPAISPPKVPVEVLIGERPVSRSADRERRAISSICKGEPMVVKSESQEDFLQRSNAVEITVRTCKISPQTPVTPVPPLTEFADKNMVKEAPSPEAPSESVMLPKTAKSSPPKEQAQSEKHEKPESEQSTAISEDKNSPDEASSISGYVSPSSRLSWQSARNDSNKSSSESSRTIDKERISSSAEGSCSCQNHGSLRSEESYTVTTESLEPYVRQALETAERRRQEYLVKVREVRASRSDDPTSPDSDTSSSVFTERETSRSEVSTSSSNRIAKSETEDESSEYVTATDQSPHSPTNRALSRKREDDGNGAHTSYESFSSPSSKSSPKPLKSSTSPPSSSSLLPHDGNGRFDERRESDATIEDNQSPLLYRRDFEDAGIYFSTTVEEDQSSDDSTKKETPPTTPSTGSEEGQTPYHKCHQATDGTSGTPDSDRTSDITPLFDPSPEPQSSLLEQQTVIEIRSEGTSEELLESNDYDDDDDLVRDDDSLPKGSNRSDRAESESSESSSVLSGLQDIESAGQVGSGMDPACGQRIQLGSFPALDIRKTADELSTVSEVSEESSKNGRPVVFRRKRPNRKLSNSSSFSEGGDLLEPAPDHGAGSHRSSSSEFVASETTTPSCDSTTSGSFILDNGSFTENGSHESSLRRHSESSAEAQRVVEKASERVAAVVRELQEESRRHEKRESESASSSRLSYKTPHHTDEELEKQSDKSDVELHGLSSPGYSALSDPSDKIAPTPSSSSSVSHQRQSRAGDIGWERKRAPLSAWCSEGAIPKQRLSEDTTRRRKERARIRSETREHTSLAQFSRQEGHHHPHHHHHHSATRSKSRSPDRSDEELPDDNNEPSQGTLTAPPQPLALCSHCGEKVGPYSAPPSWDPHYSRGPFWDVGPMWRQSQHQRAYGPPTSRYGPYSGHCHVPRSWSTDNTAPEELYPEEDEDAGVHSESYRSASWIYISDSDELAVWKNPTQPREESDAGSHPAVSRSDSTESTSSEHEFLKQYQAVTHRMIHRKSSVEMYKRLASRTFEVDKRVTVQRNNGEFGFRIHGSKPVVVSAIEKGTAAETCGLEVGDIIVSINGLNVLDATHSEVVRVAHTGTEVLKMEVSRTCHVLAPVLTDSPPPPVYSGFLQRLSARSVTGRRWCRRWFAVKLEGVLYWYRTDKDHEPLGALGLQNQTISRVPEAGAPHAFKVSKLGESPFYFSADDEDTATRWISALNQVAATASRVDPYVDESLRNGQLPPSSIPHVDCQGPLSKLSQRWKAWRRRYFLLRDATLYFYADRNAKVALGLFQLHGYKVQSCNLQGKKNTFEAIPPEPRLKHLYFLADSENEKKRWLAALEYSIDRWIKIG